MGEQGWEREIFTEYHSTFTAARAATEKFSNLSIPTADFARDLYAQLDTCLQLFQSGLTRVATVCLGNRGSRDAFGMFDSHVGVYHDVEPDPGRDTEDNPGHATNLELAMTDLAKFIQVLETTSYGDKKMIDMVTVVVSSDFGRNANFGGSRITSQDFDKDLSFQQKNRST